MCLTIQWAKDKISRLHEELHVAELEQLLNKEIVTTNVLHGS